MVAALGVEWVVGYGERRGGWEWDEYRAEQHGVGARGMRLLGSGGLLFVLGCCRSRLPVKAAGCCQHVWFFRYADDMFGLAASEGMRVLIVEDEPYMAEAIRDGLRLEAIAADIAGDGETALELLSINAYDIAVLDRDIPGPSGDENTGEKLRPQRRVPRTRRQLRRHARTARSPLHSWFPRLTSRFSAASNAYAPTTQASASA